jgi:uncharacterized protein YdgA (DUF945 family)
MKRLAETRPERGAGRSGEPRPLPAGAAEVFNLIPSMASVQTVLVNNDVTKPLFDIAKNTI